MAECARSVPDGYHSVNPYIVVTEVEALVDFLREVLGGVERGEREVSADGTIGHAEVEIGDSVVMLKRSDHGVSVSAERVLCVCRGRGFRRPKGGGRRRGANS